MSADWPIVRLGDYCSKIGSGATPTGGSSVYLEQGEICLIRSQNIYNDGFKPDGLVFLTEDAAHKLKNVIVQKNDVLLNITGDSVARVCLAREEFLPARVNQHVAIIRPNPDEFDPRYLRYLLASPAMQSFLLTIAAVGATRNALTKIMIETLEVSKPPIQIQTAIADQLELLDKKIHLNTQTNQTLESIAQAIFKSWFVDFEPVKAKMATLAEGGTHEQAELAAMGAISGKSEAELAQLQQQNPEHYQQLAETAALFPSAMVESELGEIPEGWEVLKIESVLQRITIKNRYTKTEVYPYGKTPVFEQGTGILLGYHNGQAEIQASPENPAFIFGDHTCVMHLSCSPFDISANVIPLKGNKYPTIWTYYAVLGKQGFQEYRRHWSELAVKDVIAPINDALTYVFERMIRTNLLLQEELKKESSSLAELRDSLLPKLLSGELNLE